jgi:hypothetical protein
MIGLRFVSNLLKHDISAQCASRFGFARSFLTAPIKDQPGVYGKELADRLIDGDRFALSKAITLGASDDFH